MNAAGNSQGATAPVAALAIRTRMIYACHQDKQEPDMAEAAFNTIAEIQRLRDAGIEQKQAEAITLSIHAGVTGGVATKADLDLLRRDVVSGDKALKSEINLLRKDFEKTEERLDGKINTVAERLDGKIEKAKFDLTWRLLSGIAVLNALMFALFRYLDSAPAG